MADATNVYSPDFDNKGNPKPSIPELKDAIENTRLEAEGFTQQSQAARDEALEAATDLATIGGVDGTAEKKTGASTLETADGTTVDASSHSGEIWYVVNDTAYYKSDGADWIQTGPDLSDASRLTRGTLPNGRIGSYGVSQHQSEHIITSDVSRTTLQSLLNTHSVVRIVGVLVTLGGSELTIPDHTTLATAEGGEIVDAKLNLAGSLGASADVTQPILPGEDTIEVSDETLFTAGGWVAIIESADVDDNGKAPPQELVRVKSVSSGQIKIEGGTAHDYQMNGSPGAPSSPETQVCQATPAVGQKIACQASKSRIKIGVGRQQAVKMRGKNNSHISTVGDQGPIINSTFDIITVDHAAQNELDGLVNCTASVYSINSGSVGVRFWGCAESELRGVSRGAETRGVWFYKCRRLENSVARSVRDGYNGGVASSNRECILFDYTKDCHFSYTEINSQYSYEGLEMRSVCENMRVDYALGIVRDNVLDPGISRIFNFHAPGLSIDFGNIDTRFPENTVIQTAKFINNFDRIAVHGGKISGRFGSGRNRNSPSKELIFNGVHFLRIDDEAIPYFFQGNKDPGLERFVLNGCTWEHGPNSPGSKNGFVVSHTKRAVVTGCIFPEYSDHEWQINAQHMVWEGNQDQTMNKVKIDQSAWSDGSLRISSGATRIDLVDPKWEDRELVQNDEVMRVTPAQQKGIIKVWTEDGQVGIVGFDFDSPSVGKIGDITGEIAVGTGKLTDGSSDGTDGKLNVNVNATDGKIDIKNRTSSGGFNIDLEITRLDIRTFRDV